MNKLQTFFFLLFLGVLSLLPSPARALDNIVHEYTSVRSAGMGGVRYTTGLYEDNFFNNPARQTADPRTKFELIGITAEVGNFKDITALAGATGGGDPVQKLAGTTGNNTHMREQTDLFNFFLAPNEERKWSLGVGLFTNEQLDADLRQSFQVGLEAVIDLGLNLTFARSFMSDKLSVGATVHGIMRGSTDPDITFAQLVEGRSLSASGLLTEGLLVDLDLGATYVLPIFTSTPYVITAGAAINNLLGGNFNMLNSLVANLGCSSSSAPGACRPLASPRSLGLGVSVGRALWGPFVDSVVALEFTDIGADSNANLTGSGTPGNFGPGSVFRTIHIGGETHWSVLAVRAGINQGYLGLGLGVDLRFLLLDAAYYGEEMSLNSGGLEDRRIALKITLQI